MEIQQPAIVFIHGRPGPHPFHGALAESVNADFLPVDFILRWHDRDSARTRRYLSWLLCSLFFPRRNKYSIFLTEGPHFLPVIMKRLHLLSKRQKAAALLDNETLYFLKARRYRRTTQQALLGVLADYDALFCVGRMQTELAKELLSGHAREPLFIKVHSSLPPHSREKLKLVRPNLDGRQILFIGNGPSGWRAWYKGIDLLVDSINLAASDLKEQLRLKIAGLWESAYAGALLARTPARSASIEFLGHLPDLAPALSDSALYVHLGRGEAFGISIIEAMYAGVPALVSEWTGAREAVEQVDPRLVVPLDAQAAAERICWYMRLPLEQKLKLSARSREVAATYTEERALGEFRDAVNQLLD